MNFLVLRFAVYNKKYFTVAILAQAASISKLNNMSLFRPRTKEELKEALDESRLALEVSAKNINDVLLAMENETCYNIVGHMYLFDTLNAAHELLERKDFLIRKEIDKSEIEREYDKAKYERNSLHEMKTRLLVAKSYIDEKLNEFRRLSVDKNNELNALQKKQIDENDEENQCHQREIEDIKDELKRIEERTEKFLQDEEVNEKELKQNQVMETTKNASLHQSALRLHDQMLAK